MLFVSKKICMKILYTYYILSTYLLYILINLLIDNLYYYLLIDNMIYVDFKDDFPPCRC